MRPPTPVVEMIPEGTASPCSCVAASTCAPGAAAADAHGARARVDLDAVQEREVEDDAVVDDAQPAAVVAAAAHGEHEAVPAREGDRRRHVVGVRAATDECRVAVDHRVVDAARNVVTRVLGTHELARECPSEFLPRGIRDGGDGAHGVALFRRTIMGRT